MKEFNTLQERNQFKTALFDAIEEWQNDGADTARGIAIQPQTLEVEILTQDETVPPCEWVAATSLLDENQEVDADKVLDLVDNFCFLP